MMRFVTTAAAALLAMPAQAADPLSNSYWEAAYLNTSFEQTSSPSSLLSGTDDVEGFRLALSIGFSPNVAFYGDYDQRRSTGAREAYGSAGLSLHGSDRDFQPYFTATYEQIQLDDNTLPENDDEDEGWGAEVGVRTALTDLELGAGYKYLDYGKFGDTADRTGARYGVVAALQLSPQWALSAQYRITTITIEGGGAEVEREYTDYTVGFRRYFATDADRRKRKGGILTGENGWLSGSDE